MSQPSEETRRWKSTAPAARPTGSVSSRTSRPSSSAYYNVVANGTLWFLHHYLWGLATEPDLGAAFREAWDAGYVPANEAFADAVCAELALDPDALVWFHDYHLYRAPSFVRERVPDARLMQFIHIPWAEADYWHVLPEDVRRAVHEGLCANDVVGFHCERWRRNFMQAVRGDHGCRLHASRRSVARPIAIDPDEFDVLKTREDVLAEEQTHRRLPARALDPACRSHRTDEEHRPRLPRLRALLERHPELVGRVGMLALLDPSRQDVPAYAEYRLAIEREAAAVKERFGDCEPSTCGSPTTSRDRWRPTSSSTSSSSIRSSTA